MTQSELRWYKLDNAAKIYPILTSDRFTYVFRVAATLKESVNQDVLYQAILKSKKRFPSYFVRVKRGLFWYYFEENQRDPILEHESPFVCKRLDNHLNNGYMFAFYYYDKRISLEMNHSLSDGSGAIRFLTAVVFEYLKMMGKELIADDSIITLDSRVRIEELEDSYAANFSADALNPPKIPRAYFKKEKGFRIRGSGVINSFIDTSEFLSLAKSVSASITQYVVALLIYSSIATGDKGKLRKRPVNICVPVNLRGAYHSETLSNFSLYFHSIYYMKQEDPDFMDILAKVKEDFLVENSPEKIQSKLNTVCAIQKKIFIKLIPLPIKYVLFKIGYSIFGRIPTTMTFSNFGKVVIPPSMEEHIDHFSFYMGSGMKTAIAMNSFKGKTSIVFSRAVKNTDLEKTFFRFLADKGLKIELTSNYWEYFRKKGHEKIL
ncbi:MAG TPA: hypothetical protein PK113_03705 [Bacillota bacterium]|nr:hypothetical protein [Bacillota bacterium]